MPWIVDCRFYMTATMQPVTDHKCQRVKCITIVIFTNFHTKRAYIVWILLHIYCGKIITAI